jgi:hypothetical protein
VSRTEAPARSDRNCMVRKSWCRPAAAAIEEEDGRGSERGTCVQRGFRGIDSQSRQRERDKAHANDRMIERLNDWINTTTDDDEGVECAEMHFSR